MGYIGSYTTDNNWHDYHYLYLSAILVTLSNRSESNLRIKLLQNDSRINFHFYSQTYKIETT